MNRYQKQTEGFVRRITIPRYKIFKEIDDLDKFLMQIDHCIAVEYVKQFDELFINSLYELYKEKADELIIIDKTEFTKFLIRFIPIYLKEKEMGWFDEK